MDQKPSKIPSYIEFSGLQGISTKLRSALKKHSQKSLLRTPVKSCRSRVPLNGGHNATFDLSRYVETSTSNNPSEKCNYRKENKRTSYESFMSSCSDLSSISSVSCFHVRRQRPFFQLNLVEVAPQEKSSKMHSSCLSFPPSFGPRSKITTLSDEGDRAQRRRKSSNTLTHIIEDDKESPIAFYKRFLEGEGLKNAFRSSTSTKGYFKKMERKESYYHTIRASLMLQDISLLRVMQEVGTSLRCCNSKGEGLVHLSCQLGFKDVTEFLLREAGISGRVMDDTGRTPLHYAFMGKEPPSFELVQLMLEEEPDALLMRDEKGLTPLECIPRDQWETWVNFLSMKTSILLPKHFAKLAN